ncbi:MAG: peptidylprolyl isomerase [Planctomycetota bacterium]
MSLTSLLRSSGRAASSLPSRASCFAELEPRVMLSAGLGNPNNTIVDIDTTLGTITVELFDTVAPTTVSNFLSYVLDDRYDDTLIHRSVPTFVFQGGGFNYSQGVGAEAIDEFPAVPDEPSLPSVERTLSLARTSEADSGSNQWFINLTDNLELDNPDTQNGGFTVFGAVADDASWAVAQAIEALPVSNFFSAPFGELPYQTGQGWDGSSLNPPDAALVFIDDMTITRAGAAVPEPSSNAVDAAVEQLEDGSLIVSVPNTGGQPLEYRSTDGGATWQVRAVADDLTDGSPSEAVYTWSGSGSDRFTATMTDDGIALLRVSESGGETTARAFTIPGTGQLTGQLVGLQTNDGAAYLFAYSDSGDLFTVFESNQTPGGDLIFTVRNLSDDLTANSMTTPTLVDATAFVTPWGGLNLVGVDAGGDLWSVWFADGVDSDLWRADNLSDISGADPLTGGVSVYQTAWGGINITGTTAAGQVAAVWWNPWFGGMWEYTNISAAAGAPNVTADSVVAFSVRGQEFLNIVAIEQGSGDLIQIFWRPEQGEDGWQFRSAGAIVPGYSSLSGSLSVTVQADETVRISGYDAGDDVTLVSWAPGTDTWSLSNLTESATLGFLS